MDRAPYLQRVHVLPDRVASWGEFPFVLPFVRKLDVRFAGPVTFLVGENGSGKSTLLEAIADLCGLPVSGGGRNELADHHGPEERSALSPALRPSFSRRPSDGYFFRAEFHAHFASLLDQRRKDPDFWGDPYSRYGGTSLHNQSHGEAFLALFANRLQCGLYLMDEPESALSPQRQLTLLTKMSRLAATRNAQFIVATHSPILMTYPDAQILVFDEGEISSSRLEDTAHYQITRGILEAPERYWRHLLKE